MRRILWTPWASDGNGAAAIAVIAFLVVALTRATALPFSETERPAAYDVIVYGGSSAGVTAAVQASRMGKTVLLISPTQHLGGMTASGLGAVDVGVSETIGGLAREFFSYAHRYYATAAPAVAADADSPDAEVVAAAVGAHLQFQLEPRVAEAVFGEMLRGTGVRYALGEQLDRKTGVFHVGNRITELRMKSGRMFAGRMFIDATYEGDLLAAAGVRYRIGRESRAEFGESLAGVRRNPDLTAEADPYEVPSQPLSGLLPGVLAGPPGADGTGDRRVQQYNLRLCLTDAPANRVAIERPESYDARNYQLLARRLAQYPNAQLTDIFKIQPLPGNKADLNATGSFSSDMPGDESSRWAEADDDERAAIKSVYRNYTQGLLWFVANDPAVSPTIRAQAAPWGLAKNEFADTEHWPWQLYVREARRMSGSYVITQRDCEGMTTVLDPVALGSYALDSHKVTLFTDDTGQLNTEGFFFQPVEPYPISYRALVPQPDECANLLVPVCVSATHVAFNSLRMEPVFMMLGQAAGTAACLAIDQHTSVQGVTYRSLAQQLQTDDQILSWPVPDHPAASLLPVPAAAPVAGTLLP